MPPQLSAQTLDELMWYVEDENCRVFYGVYDRRVCNDVVRQGDAWEVLDVFMKVVYEAREFLRFCRELGRFVVVLGLFRQRYFLFEDPHLYISFEQIRMRGSIFRNNFCNGRTPGQVSADYGDVGHFPHQFPEPTTVTLCFFWNGVRDDILARRLSMLGQVGWKNGFERSLSRVKGD